MNHAWHWTAGLTDWIFTAPLPHAGATPCAWTVPSPFEVGAGQVGDVEMILIKNGFSDIKTYQDTAGIWRVVEGTIKK